MARQVLVACLLLLIVLVTSSTARPKRDCHRAHASSSTTDTLQTLFRKGAAIATSLRNLRYIRERRWHNSPIWKALHRIQERAVDIPFLPFQEDISRGFKASGRGTFDKELTKGLQGVQERGFWHDQPFAFPELSKPSKDLPQEEVVEDWGSVGDWGPVAYGGQQSEEPEESFAAGWGEFIEPVQYEKCSDDVIGNPCTRHSDCMGCSQHHCSSATRTCVTGSEPDPHLEGFF